MLSKCLYSTSASRTRSIKVLLPSFTNDFSIDEAIRRMASSMEKSLVKLGSKTLIERVLDALVEYRHFESIIAMPSLNTPATSTFLYTHEYYTSGKIKILEGRGVNYS